MFDLFKLFEFEIYEFKGFEFKEINDLYTQSYTDHTTQIKEIDSVNFSKIIKG